jgi:L-alanine-DL-glutamate epimerase-like enolase superfamily enzyme
VSASTGLRAEVWQVPIPLPRTILTPAGPFDTYYHLVVVLADDDVMGWGYGALASPSHLSDAAAEAVRLLSARPLTLRSVITVEHFAAAVDEQPVPAITKAAVSAIALAAWDLAAKRLGVACADLWGRRTRSDRLDCYASGFFLDASIAELVAEARAYRAGGFRLAKMRTGLSVDDDVARFEAIRPYFASPAAIAVDAVSSWAPADALAFVERVAAPLLWVEDATGYDALSEVSGAPAPLAAGESVGTLAELTELRSRARVDYALLDVQALGGPIAFLTTAHALMAQGARVGAHIFTPQSTHLLACVPDALPVEVFDWSDPLFESPLRPGPDGRLQLAGPGFGIALRRETLDALAEPPTVL